jgi:adenylate kinase family enzyme
MACGMRRVVVLGSSGSGKTTLARELARRLSVPHVELDALHWKPNWTSTPTEQLIEEVRVALDAADAKAGGWTVCGHYGQVRQVTWGRADTIIFLDYPMRVVFLRMLRRTLRRCWRKEELWNGNRESLWAQLVHPDSLFLWVIKTWRLRRRDVPRHLRDPRFAHVRAMRFGSPAALQRWLDSAEVPKCPKMSHLAESSQLAGAVETDRALGGALSGRSS